MPVNVKIVDLRPFKDANEVLLQEGVESLRNRLKMAQDPKLEGVFEVTDVMESMLDGFHNGQERGTTTYIPAVDEAWTWRKQEITIWTGYQNEGKSLFLNQPRLRRIGKVGSLESLRLRICL